MLEDLLHQRLSEVSSLPTSQLVNRALGPSWDDFFASLSTAERRRLARLEKSHGELALALEKTFDGVAGGDLAYIPQVHAFGNSTDPEADRIQHQIYSLLRELFRDVDNPVLLLEGLPQSRVGRVAIEEYMARDLELSGRFGYTTDEIAANLRVSIRSYAALRFALERPHATAWGVENEILLRLCLEATAKEETLDNLSSSTRSGVQLMFDAIELRSRLAVERATIVAKDQGSSPIIVMGSIHKPGIEAAAQRAGMRLWYQPPPDLGVNFLPGL